MIGGRGLGGVLLALCVGEKPRGCGEDEGKVR